MSTPTLFINAFSFSLSWMITLKYILLKSYQMHIIMFDNMMIFSSIYLNFATHHAHRCQYCCILCDCLTSQMFNFIVAIQRSLILTVRIKRMLVQIKECNSSYPFVWYVLAFDIKLKRDFCLELSSEFPYFCYLHFM